MKPDKLSLAVSKSSKLNSFIPVQPAAFEKTGAEQFSYHEYPPSTLLSEFVYCYWELKCENADALSASYGIVPDGCIDIILNCSVYDGLSVIPSYTEFSEVTLEKNDHIFGIRFLPGKLPFIVPFNAIELDGQSQQLDAIHSAIANDLQQQLFEAKDNLQRIQLVELFLKKRLYDAKSLADYRLDAALDQVYNQQGNAAIESAVAELISPRQLRRIFNQYVGLSPKEFSRIIRFQKILYAMMQTPKGKWKSMHLDFGFYDQAHFIREFKAFYGKSPMSVNFK